MEPWYGRDPEFVAEESFRGSREEELQSLGWNPKAKDGTSRPDKVDTDRPNGYEYTMN